MAIKLLSHSATFTGYPVPMWWPALARRPALIMLGYLLWACKPQFMTRDPFTGGDGINKQELSCCRL